MPTADTRCTSSATTSCAPIGEAYVARSYVEAIVLRGDNIKGLQMYGYYDDRFVLTGEGWQISSRQFVPTLTVRVAA